MVMDTMHRTIFHDISFKKKQCGGRNIVGIVLIYEGMLTSIRIQHYFNHSSC